MWVSMMNGSRRNSVAFRHRGRDLNAHGSSFLNEVIERDHCQRRNSIVRHCEARQWRQPNGKFREYAAKDLLLCLEEKDFVQLPARRKGVEYKLTLKG